MNDQVTARLAARVITIDPNQLTDHIVVHARPWLLDSLDCMPDGSHVGEVLKQVDLVREWDRALKRSRPSRSTANRPQRVRTAPPSSQTHSTTAMPCSAEQVGRACHRMRPGRRPCAERRGGSQLGSAASRRFPPTVRPIQSGRGDVRWT